MRTPVLGMPVGFVRIWGQGTDAVLVPGQLSTTHRAVSQQEGELRAARESLKPGGTAGSLPSVRAEGGQSLSRRPLPRAPVRVQRSRDAGLQEVFRPTYNCLEDGSSQQVRGLQ